MQPYNRNRTSRDVAEDVHVKLSDASARHPTHTNLRRRLSKRSSTYLTVACGALFAICVLAVYLFTTLTPSVDGVVAQNDAQRQAAQKATATDVPAGGETTTTTTAIASVQPTSTVSTTTTRVAAPNPPMQYVNIFDREDTRTARPEAQFEDLMNQYESGEYAPEEPDRLPGLTVSRRTFTSDELLQLYADTDYLYSFVNGSELNHHFRKATLGSCQVKFKELETSVYTSGGILPTAMQVEHNNNTPACYPSYLNKGLKEKATMADFLNIVVKYIRPNIGDRETDELRHSLRSVEQHIRWHRGRVLIVSPGHHPTWVDGAKNFLAGVCGDATVQALRSRGTHLRLTTVHQDAVMPYGIRLTVDSHSIEQHIWRVRNTTAVHVYMNDDYFVNRDVAITDLFNEYGGTIVRTEKGILRNGIRGPVDGGTWGEGVRNTHLFNIMELDLRHDDYLPEDLKRVWMAEKEERHENLSSPIPPIALEDIVDAAYSYDPVEWPRTAKPRRHRRYATHAPFVYCTNMHRFLQTRYAREFAHYSYIHRSRRARDLYVPFVYNAFVMARPWQASPKFLPYLLQLHHNRKHNLTEAPLMVDISLDNFDSCGQSTLRGGRTASECTYGKFVDNATANMDLVGRIRDGNPLYFNINAGFNTPAAAEQLRKFLHEKFPTPMYLEQAADAATTADPEEAAAGGEEEGTTTTTTAANAVVDAALTTLFDSLMALPVVGVVSHVEGACPLVRSLSLAFAGHHRGRVHVAVQRSNDGAEAETLRETRNRLGNRIVSAMSSLLCAFSSRVVVEASAVAESVADVARRVLAESDGAGVVLPSTCGGGFAGLRVRGFVVDARAPKTPVTSLADLPSVLAMPGQTLALEDFRAVRVGADDGDVVLVLAREDAAAKAVHWVTGASENDLLLTFPLPVEAYEDLNAPVKWSQA